MKYMFDSDATQTALEGDKKILTIAMERWFWHTPFIKFEKLPNGPKPVNGAVFITMSMNSAILDPTRRDC